MVNGRKIFLALGIVVILIPFLGIPSSYKTTMYFLIGISLIIIYVFTGREVVSGVQDEELMYVESIEEKPIQQTRRQVIEDIVDEEEPQDEMNKFDKYFVDE